MVDETRTLVTESSSREPNMPLNNLLACVRRSSIDINGLGVDWLGS